MNSQLSSGELLNECDREPIHLPGAIQPHGLLLAFDLSDLRLAVWSDNAEEWLENFQGESTPFQELLPGVAEEDVHRVTQGPNGIVRSVTLPASNGQRVSQVAMHRIDGLLVVELEADSDFGTSLCSLPLQLNQANQHLQTARAFEDLFDIIAKEVRAVSGYDRVMVYHFLPDGHGHVVGESVDDRFESFRGLHYPATDIPQQARRLYKLNTVRSIADIEATPCPLVPQDNPVTGRPLDLSYSRYRAVSPVHVEYLHNMGVRASMSISILCEGELWGLVACHHYSPRQLSFEQRAACEIMGVMAGGYLTTGEQGERNRQIGARRETLLRSTRRMAGQDSLPRAVASELPLLAEILQADGAAVCWQGGVELMGDTPPPEVTQALCEAVESLGNEDVKAYQSVGESGLCADLSTLGTTCGMLWLPVSTEGLTGVCFFRNEYTQVVTWAGDPAQAKIEKEGDMRLSPRLSFEAWKQTVSGRCQEWSDVDLQIAEEVRTGLVELLGRRAAELTRLNEELNRINSDLDSFAYTASHDLREPLRGLSQTVFMLREHLGDGLDEETEKRCASIERLSARMDELIGGLLRLSRAGKGDLQLATFGLDEVVQEAASLVPELQEWPVRIQVDDCPVTADYLCVRELLTNLITNGLKYNKSEEKVLEFGSIERKPSGDYSNHSVKCYYVRDNGIGIPAEHATEVFQIFRRLHGSEAYGRGSGAGLAIVRKIAQRHGGDAWIESDQGEGTTVWFTLGDDK